MITWSSVGFLLLIALLSLNVGIALIGFKVQAEKKAFVEKGIFIASLCEKIVKNTTNNIKKEEK